MATGDSSNLTAFIQFATVQMQTDAELTLEEALDRWWEAHPPEFSNEEAEEIETMIQEALGDIAAGEKGIPFEEFSREFKQRNGLK
jgi:hypothetical protein